MNRTLQRHTMSSQLFLSSYILIWRCLLYNHASRALHAHIPLFLNKTKQMVYTIFR